MKGFVEDVISRVAPEEIEHQVSFYLPFLVKFVAGKVFR